jgi:hypothetical protein
MTRETYFALPSMAWAEGMAIIDWDSEQVWESLLDFLGWCEALCVDPYDVHIVVAKPVYCRELEAREFIEDFIPEDADAPDWITEALNAFNDSVRGKRICWDFTQTRIDLREAHR